MIDYVKVHWLPAVIFIPVFALGWIPYDWVTPIAITLMVISLIYCWLDANFIQNLDELGSTEGKALHGRMIQDGELTLRREIMWTSMIFVFVTMWFNVMDPATFYGSMCILWFSLRHWSYMVRVHLCDYDDIDDLI
jgi:hypothetical protein